jgi:acyl-coenzyme A synthetase/AMP-(fatty) acid ligase
MLSGLPEIKQIAVTKIPDELEQNLPKYHIVLSSSECDIHELENKIYNLISSTLGESAAPGYIEYHEEPLPRTDNGKLNVTLLEKEDIENIEIQKVLRKRR